jgi:hypothetical protein
VPAVEAEALPFDLREINARAEERVHRLVQRWKLEDRSLESELGDLEQRAAAANARLADAEMQRDAALATDESRKVDEEQRLARLQEQLEELSTPDPSPFATPTSVAPTPETRGPSALIMDTTDGSWRGLAPIVYWALVALIVVGEIPLNAFAFRLFHESDLLTYAMTVTVAVGLVAFAHGLGLLVSRPERSTVERILVGAFVLVPLAAIAVISLVRYGYLIDVGGDAGVGPVLGTLAFGCINLLVFGAAAGLSYLHHDPRTLVNRRAAVRATEREHTRAARRQMAREQERTRRQIELETQRRQADLQSRKDEALVRREQIVEAMRPLREVARQRAERLDELNGFVDAARADLGAAEQRLASIASERRTLWEATNARVREVKAGRDRLVFAYCSANVHAREGHHTPRSFEFVPPLEVPSGFDAAMVEVA